MAYSRTTHFAVLEMDTVLLQVDNLKEEVRKFAALVNNPSVRLHVQAYSQLVKVINSVESRPSQVASLTLVKF